MIQFKHAKSWPMHKLLQESNRASGTNSPFWLNCQMQEWKRKSLANFLAFSHPFQLELPHWLKLEAKRDSGNQKGTVEGTTDCCLCGGSAEKAHWADWPCTENASVKFARLFPMFQLRLRLRSPNPHVFYVSTSWHQASFLLCGLSC